MITIIKIGGNVIDDDLSLENFLDAFSKIEGKKILVHGGGKLATELSNQLGIQTRMINGRRATDAETLKIAVMVYAGWINKNIVAKLAGKNCPAIGLTGADASLLLSEKRKAGEIDFGFAGDPVMNTANINFINQLFAAGISPVIAPVTHDGKGQLLNTNADTMAAALASALAEKNKVQLIFCFEKNGVLSDFNEPGSIVTELNIETIEKMTAEGKINSGMLPKLHAAIAAKESGVERIVIGNAAEIKLILNESGNYTTII